MKKTLLLVALSFAVLASACNKPQTEDKYAAEMEKVAKNNELATRFFTSAWNNGDFAVVDELIPADALDHALIPGKSPEQGPASFKSIIGMFRAAMPDIKLTIHDDFGSGDKIVHRWSLTGHHTGAALMGVPATGKEISFGGITIVRIENGKIMERWASVDVFGVLVQLGVVPPPGPPPAEKK